MNLFNKAPSVAEDAFVAPSAAVVGDVEIGPKSSVWYGCVLRGKLLLSSLQSTKDLVLGLQKFCGYQFWRRTTQGFLKVGQQVVKP